MRRRISGRKSGSALSSRIKSFSEYPVPKQKYFYTYQVRKVSDSSSGNLFEVHREIHAVPGLLSPIKKCDKTPAASSNKKAAMKGPLPGKKKEILKNEKN